MHLFSVCNAAVGAALRRGSVSLAAATLACLVVTPAARGDSVSNEESAVPICVDGFLDPIDAEPLAYTTGSLYQTTKSDPGRTNEFRPLVAPIEGARGLHFVAGVSSLLVPPGTYAAGQRVADITLCVLLSGAPTPVTVQVRGARNRKSGPFEYLADIGGDGVSDGAASKLGIVVVAAFTPSSLPTVDPHLVVELAVPLGGPKAVFCNGRVSSVFYKNDGSALPVTDGLVDIITVGGTRLTSGDSFYVPSRIAIEIKNFVDLNKQGLVPVVIPSTDTFDAMTVDPNTVVLRDSRVSVDFLDPDNTLGAFYRKGARPVKSNSRSGAAGQDLVLWFDSVDLRNPDKGAFTLDTTEVTLAGQTFSGDTISGKGSVQIAR